MEHKGTVTIETDRLILRKVELCDVKNLTELLKDKDVQDFLAGIPENYTEEMAVSYISNKLEKNYNKEDYYDWAVVEKETDKLIGRIGLFKQDDERMMADLVWYINKESVGYKRIEAFANVKNKASQRVMEKCGFSFEGTLKKYDLDREGNLYDANMFSIVCD